MYVYVYQRMCEYTLYACVFARLCMRVHIESLANNYIPKRARDSAKQEPIESLQLQLDLKR